MDGFISDRLGFPFAWLVLAENHECNCRRICEIISILFQFSFNHRRYYESFLWLFILLGILFYRKEQAIKNKSTAEMTGKIIDYSYDLSRAPIVEYTVKGKTYQQYLKYSYISRFASIFSLIQATAKDDSLDTKLRI